MKSVIYTPVPVNSITLDEVKKLENPLLGFLVDGKNKSTLIPTNYLAKTYFARAVSGWERGNCYNPHQIDKKTIPEWCDFYIKYNNNKAEIFLFDSPKELFKWLSAE